MVPLLEPDQRCDRRDEYTDEIIADCVHDLLAIGSDAIRIRQKLTEFMDRWRAGFRAHELKAGFDYKQLSDPGSKELRIKQIRVAVKYRAALIIVESRGPRIVFLSVYIKNRQPDGIKTAVRRARKYWSEGAEQ